MKPSIRLPNDPGPNPYDSKTSIEDVTRPTGMFQFAGRTAGWWGSILALGIGSGLISWAKSRGLL